MKIKRFINNGGLLNFEDSEGNIVDFSGWNTSIIRDYEKKNNLKVADLIKEFCIEIEPKSIAIFEFINTLSKEHNTYFSFDCGDVASSNVILGCFINYPHADYDIDVKLIYDSISKSLTPSIEFMISSTRGNFGYNIFKHFTYSEIDSFYYYIKTYLSDDNEKMLKDIVKRIYQGM